MHFHVCLRRSNRPTLSWTLGLAATGIGLVVMAVLAGAAFGSAISGGASGGGAGGEAPVIESISPNQVIEEPVPQPDLVITGSDLIVGFPGPNNLPTVTITHTALPAVTFSAQADDINFAGTEMTILGANNDFNMLQMPLGEYDLTLSRPDGASTTVPGGFSLITEPEPAPGSIEMRVASWWGGPIHGMDVQGDLAYLANGRVLRILDISDPSNPVSLGSIHLRGVNDVKVRDGYAFVAGQQQYGFCVVDVSDPTAPDLVWVANPVGTRQQVELHGDYAYVRGSSIVVYDISDPLNVVHANNFAPNTESFTIDGDRLFVANGGAGTAETALRVFNLAADPIDPPQVAFWSGSDSGFFQDPKSIAVKGDHAYIAVHDQDSDLLLTIDVSDPGKPVLVSTIEDFDFLRYSRLAVEGDRLYLIERMERAYNLSDVQGLAIYDIGANSAAPALVASHQTRGGVGGVLPDSDGETLYLWDLGEGLLIMDAADPLNLQRIGNYHSPTDLREMAKSGDSLYIADGWGGLTILNVADGAAPVVESVYLPSTEPDGYVDAYGIVERDGLVYLTLRRRLEVIDVNDPANPTLVGTFHLDQVPQSPYAWNDNWIRAVSVSGDIAYLGYGRKPCLSSCEWPIHLLQINISDPGDISLHQLSDVLGGSTALYPKDSITAIASKVVGPLMLPMYHYAAQKFRAIVEDNGNDGGEMIQSPVLEAEDLVVKNGLAFTAMSGGGHPNPPELRGLRIEDISDPVNPVTLSITNSAFDATRAYAVDVQNDRAYVTSNVSGGSLHVLEVTDPSSPTVLDTVSVRGLQGHALADEPHVYLTHESYGGSGVGFAIVHVHGTEPVVPSDLNGDGTVNVLDLLLLLSAWGECAPPGSSNCPSDLNEDGQVNVLDMLVLLGEWG